MSESQGPEDVSARLVAFLEDDDIEGVMGLYERDAVFVDLDGIHAGGGAIRLAHERFREAGLTLALNRSTTVQVGDLALVQWSWTVSGPDGATAEGSSAEVLRRQSDGSWKFVIDNSDGPAIIGLV